MQLFKTLRRVVAIAMAVGIGLGVSGCGTSTTPVATVASGTPVTLTYWRMFDDQESLDPIIKAYRATRMNVTVRTRVLRPEEYESALLNAWADDKGPDIFSIPATWLNKYKAKIVPMPKVIKETIGTVINPGGMNEATQFSTVTEPGLNLATLRSTYVDSVTPAAVRDGSVYGLPLGVDTLGLFYNRDIFNSAGVALPPTTWEQFKEVVKKVTVVDKKGSILRSAAAIGTGANIDRSFDLISAIMMQNGAQMTNGSNVTFDQMAGEALPGLDAVRFYTDFANPAKDTYTWNSTYPNSLQAFAQGQTAMFFGYGYNIRQIQALNPSLNFGIAPFPQIDGSTQPANYASMFLEVVSKKSKHQDEAWDLINFATSAKNVSPYLSYTKKPSAVRSLLQTQQDDEFIGPFASQALVARGWYQGYDAKGAENALISMVENFLKIPIDEKPGVFVDEIIRAKRAVQITYEAPVVE